MSDTPKPHVTLALDPHSDREVAECGCTLHRNGKSFVFHRFCPMHTAAPEMLRALDGLLHTSYGIRRRDALSKARTAVRAAKGDA